VNFIETILKGKSFPLQDRNRLKAAMITLLVLLSILFFSLDLYESYAEGYHLMSMMEIGMIIILILLYLLFPFLVSLSQIIAVTLFSITVFLLTSLAIPDINPEVSLFWLAASPIAFFYFLGAEKGMKSTFFVFIILIVLTLLDLFGRVTLLFNNSLMLQLSVGYLVISYWAYMIEKERSVYANNLATALSSQEVLFKEVHHRTKNNMQVIMGLLETQSFKISDPQYKKMFQSHVERIKAMSLVHENLYKNGNYEKVDMHKYLGEIVEGLQKFTAHTIISDIDFVYLDIKLSMSLGLILNEAISNAIEHAYNTENGYIDISLKCLNGECTLRIKDYGQGMNLEKMHTSSLGMSMIEDLGRSLPDGEIYLKVEDGTEIKIVFTIPKEK
jgi:two-component sensor histidine kinase